MKDSMFHSRPPVDARAVGAAEPMRMSEGTLAAENLLTPVVGLGGSTGSLDALQRLFQRTPKDTGLAFVVVVHLSAEHESVMAEILQRSTTMPVAQVTDPVRILPNHVYVIPPGKHLSTSGGLLTAIKLAPHKRTHVTVDYFFRLLAESHGTAAVAIVLSGRNGDGAAGVKSIKEHGGLTIAQDPAEAEQPGMPQSAIETGMVDCILTVDQMPTRLIDYHNHGKKLHLAGPAVTDNSLGETLDDERDERALREILKLSERISPPSVVINRDHQIVHLSASAEKYLQCGSGEPSMELLRVIHPQLKAQLEAALLLAAKSKASVEIHDIAWQSDGITRLVDLSLIPADDLGLDSIIILFHEKHASNGDVAISPRLEALPDSQVVLHLQEKLDQMKAGWRESVEQHQGAVQELSAFNEELQAMNEELRSTTEELEIGREELQSTNEEIVTINQELKINVDELSQSNSDLQNLMASSQIATIFLDLKLRIKRFTPTATDLFSFISTDIGRPFSDLSHRFDYPAINRDTEEVLAGHCFLEREVRNLDGRWFLARMFPYLNTAGQCAGVVITCVDITERKGSESVMRLLSSIVESSNDAIISFTMEGNIVSWNRSAERVFGYTAEEMIGCPLAVLTPADKLSERAELFDALRRGDSIDQYETVRVRKDGQRIDISISASTLNSEAGDFEGATAIIQDITIRKKALADLQLATEELELKVASRTAELRTRVEQLALMASELTQTEQRERKRMAHVLHDQLQQILVAAKMRIESLDPTHPEQWESDINEVVALVDEALANSRSLAVELSPPVLVDGLARALEWLCGSWFKEKYYLNVEVAVDPSIDAQQEDMRTLVFLTVKELLFNVVKHSSAKKAFVELAVHDSGRLRVTVRDGGQGFDPRKLGTVLDTGSGFGLNSLNERLLLLDGSLDILSRPGFGVEAIILAPMKLIH